MRIIALFDHGPAWDMDSDPAVIAGLLTYRLRVVQAYFDCFAGTRTPGPAASSAGRITAGRSTPDSERRP